MEKNTCCEPEKSSCCCGPKVQKTDSKWTHRDYYGAAMCRLSNRFRSSYTVKPGLYAIGSPAPESPVLVTANYKLTFNLVRRDLRSLDAWILVLDTSGINVWCAAGKGTFGTEELIRQIESSGLSRAVTTKQLILPQLGASGIAAHEVRKRTGFKVLYGPVRSIDVAAYLHAGAVATKEMRTVTFRLKERAVLVPIEVTSILKKTWLPMLIVFLAMGFKVEGIIFKAAWELSFPLVIALGAAIVSGCMLHPVVLPYLIIRSFALQGLLLGIVVSCSLFTLGIFSSLSMYGTAAATLLISGLSSYCAFNFTGSTPIANKSGVKKELRMAVPLYIVTTVAIIVLLVLYKLSFEGVL